jgi:sialate O-acetylesterase
MVLQAGQRLPVWGTASAGERIEVRFAGTRAAATAGADGRWRVDLPPQEPAAIGRRLVIEGRETITLADIVVGEVWLCAGQSNMLLPFAKAEHASADVSAGDPLLRLLRMVTAAGGDSAAYTAEQIAALRTEAFASGSWACSSPATLGEFSAVAVLFARRLREELGVPVGVIQLAVGGAPTEAWVARGALAASPETAGFLSGDWMQNPLVGEWCRARAAANLARAFRADEAIPGDEFGANHPFKPGFLWEAGVAPLLPFPLAGVCWYQGESNAETAAGAALHEAVFAALVADWRRAWRRDDLPFGFVQLPGMKRPHWPAFRDGQRRLRDRIPHTGMAVSIDLDDEDDVHPRDKRPVGERLAGWALADVYGRDVAGSSPLPVSATRLADGRVRIEFAHAAAGLATTDGGPPRHFETAGAADEFQPAEAVIEGGAVVLAAAAEPPHRVRYAWQPFPRPVVNLVGRDGLPVTPFELDVTEGQPR